MKIYSKMVAVAALCATFTSCFKDEAPNAECDIEEAFVSVSNAKEVFNNLSDTLLQVSSTTTDLIFQIKRKATVTNFAPQFKLTEGATISPANGSEHDFSKGPVVYTVTSQDANYSRVYRVSFKKASVMVGDTVKFDFEHYVKANLTGLADFYKWQEKDGEGMQDVWGSGNAGFSLSAWDQPAEADPAIPIDGFDGKAVQLTTRSTGSLGKLVKMPIAAGNLFYGTFDLRNALADALKATQFGHPFNRKPLTVTGYYKYTPAKTVTDRASKVLEDVKDSAAIYAVFYRNHDDSGQKVVLDGSNIKTSNLIVAMADMDYVAPKEDWTEFEIKFKYLTDIDLDVLEQNGYSLALVFSSSKQGDRFIGAIGGTAPVGLPRTIRHMNSYTLMPNFQFGIDAERRISPLMGVMLGLRLENKGMRVDARVKNYHMAIEQGTQHLEGQFTGDVKTKVNEWMFTVPVMAAFHVGDDVRLKAGMYASYVLSRQFEGYAHGGYLRVGGPTGAKINIGEEPGQRGDYDFSNHMRRLQVGLTVGCDWTFCEKWGGYLDLNWGLNGIHHSSFKTIEQTLYPIFATVGATYNL